VKAAGREKKPARLPMPAGKTSVPAVKPAGKSGGSDLGF
jgi:hypothetical protein